MQAARQTELACLSLLGLLACGPSASVWKTSPVADLQSYQVALVRVASAPGLEHYSPILEFATTTALQRKCSLNHVVGAGQTDSAQPDLIVDLNIRQTQRGGTGFIKNPNLATVDVTMVLSDGIDESLLGSAEIKGKSSAVSIEGADPENDALMAVAKRVSLVLAKSGCEGQRLARVAQPAPDTPTAPTQPGPPATDTNPEPEQPQASSEQIAQAEAANDEGKRLFRSAEIAAAREQFKQALTLAQDPRYYFNLCLAHEALSDLDSAMKACNSVLAAEPEPRLAEKANQRLQLIADKRGA